MRRLPLLACALVLATSAPAAGSSPGTGGTAAPTSGGSVAFKQPIKPRTPARGPIGPVATRFAVAPARLVQGSEAKFVLRIDGRADRVRVRIELTRRGGVAPAVRLRLGEVDTGERIVHRWTPRENELPPAVYDVALQAIDRQGRALHRTAKAAGRGRLEVEVPPPRPRRPRPARSTASSRSPGRGRSAGPSRASAPAGPGTSTRARTSRPRRGPRSSPRSPRRSTGSPSRRAAPASTSCCAGWTAATTCSCTSSRARSPSPRARRWPPGSSSAWWGARAPRAARTCTSRSGRRLVLVQGVGADRPPAAAAGVGGGGLD